MKIRATCSSCHTVLAVASENAGKKARCPKCSAIISIPYAAPSQPDTQQAGKPQPQSGTRADSPRSNQPEPPLGQDRRIKEGQRQRPPQKGKTTPPRRRKEPDVEDVWNQPLSSYSSPAIEEEDYEAYGIAPRGRRNRDEYNPYAAHREVGTYNSYSPPSLKVPLIMAGIGIGSVLLFSAIGLAVPSAAFVGTAIGGLIGSALMMWGGIRLLMNAFEDDPITGVLYLMCGPYAIYFLVSRWSINQHPFLINLLGSLVWIIAMAAGAANTLIK